MSKKSTKYKNLVDSKIAVINYHSGDSLTYLRESIARDACYTSANSIQYKSDQISENRDKLADLRETYSGQEVIHVQMSKLAYVIGEQQKELSELDLRFKADCAVFKQLTKKAWTPKSKASGSNSKLMMKSEVEAIANG